MSGIKAVSAAAGLLLFARMLPGAGGAEQPPRDIVLVIPHTHWEGAVFKTREEYLEIGLPNILKALYLLKKYPNYRFVLDQECYVRPFIERYPTEVAAFLEFLKQGRLQIAGGTDTMHDNNMPSAESIARQYLLGKSWFREKLGYDVKTGWALDTFGHNAQMPQILKLAGMKSYWFQRGVHSPVTPSEFLWRGIDGTVIPAFWLPIGYAPLYDLPVNAPDFARLLLGKFDSLTQFSHGHERVLMAGADVWEPEESLPVSIDQFNKSGQQFTAKLAVPSEFEELVSKRSDRSVIDGELNPVFQGIYSSRIEVKQAMRRMERLLTTAEKLDVIASVLGASSQAKFIEEAWEPVLFNQTHDLTSGVMVDKVYADSMQRYADARHATEDLIRASLSNIERHVNTLGKGVPIMVLNSLNWSRTDIAEVDVPFSEPDVQRFALLDAQGRGVPIQTSEVLRNGDGGIRQAHVAFLARNIPGLGYAVYHAVPNIEGPATAVPESYDTTRDDKGSLQNEFYRASFNLWNGDITSLVLKDDNWEALASPGNVIAREYDGGDFWELYGTLNGARFTSMKKQILGPRPAYSQWSSDFVGGSGSIRSGPVFSEFHITHPLGKNQFSTRVRIYRGLRRIDISTGLVNQEELVRYRALFPSSIQNGTLVEEIPFGAIQRPERQEFPAQNWIDYGDGTHGISLINEGIPGNNVTDGTVMLSLMRSARLISYGFTGGYEPGVGSDTGLGIGQKYTLNYAVVPHPGDWRSAHPWRSGLEFNNPLITRTVAPQTGELPAVWGLLEVPDEDTVLSALKTSKDGSIVLRVYEAAGRQHHHVHAIWHTRISAVHESNLIEDTGARVDAQPQDLQFDLRPYEIRTFKTRLTSVGTLTPVGQGNATATAH